MSEQKRFLDYIIYHGSTSTVFRFDTEYSTCHSFNDKPPTKWEEVYKVYYYYQIVEMDMETGEIKEVLFDSKCDECSVLDEIAERCKYLAEGKKQVKIDRDGAESYTIRLLNQEIKPCGMGVFWTIRQSHKKFRFDLFDWWDKGYRFWIERDKVGEFGKFLESCCEYMLAHGVPI